MYMFIIVMIIIAIMFVLTIIYSVRLGRRKSSKERTGVVSNRPMSAILNNGDDLIDGVITDDFKVVNFYG